MSYGLAGEIITPEEAVAPHPGARSAAILSAATTSRATASPARGDVCRRCGARRVARRRVHRPHARHRRRHGEAGACAASRRPTGRSRPRRCSCARASGRPEMQALARPPLVAMQPMQHLFAWTNPLPELAGATREIEHPILRHQDRDVYYRQRGEQYGIGSYGHDPLPIDVARARARIAEGHQIAQGAFTPEHFPESLGCDADARAAARARRHRRVVQRALRVHGRHQLVRRELAHVAGSSSPRASGSRTAAARRKAVVDLMSTGRCALDLGPMHPDRLQPHQRSPLYVRARGNAAVRRGLRRPAPAAGAGASARPAHDAVPRALPRSGAELVESAGWERAQWFASNDALPLPARAADRDRLGAAVLVADDRARAPRDAHRRAASST